MPLEVRIIRGADWFPTTQLSLFVLDRETKHCVKTLTLEKMPEEGMPLSPILRLEPTQAQVLMDDLWDCGVRPSEGSGSAGALAATQKHLKDMKTVAFHVMKIKGGAP